MKILFLGGTGTISSACTELAMEQGHDLVHINRGMSRRKYEGVETYFCDVRNTDEMKRLLEGKKYDVVVDWLCFNPENALADLDLFRDKTAQFIYISSSSVYKKPVDILPVSEDSPTGNPAMKYARDKLEAEGVFINAFKHEKFPAAVVRPAQTYDRTVIPTHWGYTDLDRMLRGKKVVIQGDGTSVTVITHNSDFAKGLNGLFGKQEASGGIFNITSDEILNWNRVYKLLAEEFGVTSDIVHIPSDFIVTVDKNVGSNLVWNRSHSMIFDNSRIRKLVPDFKTAVSYEQGVKEIHKWYERNPGWGSVNPDADRLIDMMIDKYMAG